MSENISGLIPNVEVTVRVPVHEDFFGREGTVAREQERVVASEYIEHLLAEAWSEGYTAGHIDTVNERDMSRENPYWRGRNETY